MTNTAFSSQRAGTLLAILAFALFATHDALIKFLGAEYAVFQIMFFAVMFGFPPIALSMSAASALENFRPNHPWWLAIRCMASVIAQVCVFYAFTTLPLAEVYAILFATPLLVTVLSIPFLGEVVRLRRWIAIIVGLSGVLIVIRPGYIDLSIGHMGALIGAVLSAFSSVIVRKIGPNERSAVLVLYPLTATVISMSLVLPFVYIPMPLPDLGITAVIGLLAFAGQFAIIGAYKRASATLVAPMQYSQILWATFFGMMFFQEYPDIWVAVGSSVIVASGIYIVFRESKISVSEEKPVLNMPNLRHDAGPSPDPKGHMRPAIFSRTAPSSGPLSE